MKNKSNICINFKSGNQLNNSDTYWDIIDDMLDDKDKIEFFASIKNDMELIESLESDELLEAEDEFYLSLLDNDETMH